MITSLTYTNLNAVSVTLNDLTYPLHLYDDPITSRIEKRTRSGQDGSWPTFPYEEGMEITMEGAICGSDSDDYWTKRQALISCFRYKPTPRQRRSGILRVHFDNAPVTFRVDVVIDTMSVPRNGASPAYSEFRIVLYSFTPYYVSDADGVTPYYDS